MGGLHRVGQPESGLPRQKPSMQKEQGRTSRPRMPREGPTIRGWPFILG